MASIRYLVLILLATGTLPARAQNIPREEYLHFLPLDAMSIRNQTEANAELGLFGNPADPDYRDVSPRDGIDDRRGAVMRELGVRFAPIMVLNTTNFPVDHRWYERGPGPLPLVTDRWDVSGPSPVLVESNSLDWRDLGGVCGPDSSGADCAFLELLRRHHPIRPTPPDPPRYARSPRWFEVLYLDFPGEDETSWRESFGRALHDDPAAAEARLPLHHVHPFLTRDDATGDYELTLQYWFFYPYNDGGNNHEGDWEHLNVVIGPKSRLGRKLTADQVNGILDGVWPESDPLVLFRVEYYFHHNVMALDFTAPDAYQDRAAWEAERDRVPEDRAGQRRLLGHVRDLAFADVAETRINTHPVIFVGADNKGTDQILSSPGGKNRDSHGSYPLSGMYKDIGPAGATEQIGTTFDHKEWFASGGPEAPLDARRGEVVSFARPERIRVVPDWEQVLPLVEAEGPARRDWGWLVLPLRWGYPASMSPFAGVVEHAETGNLSVPGPAYNAGWNRLGTAPGFSWYEPHMIYSLFPLGWQDNFQNDLGFLNLTYPTWIVVPPLDFAWRIASAPLRLFIKKEGPIFYPKEKIPSRFFGVSYGRGVQSIPDRFNDLLANDTQFNEFVVRLILHLGIEGDSTTTVTGFDKQITDKDLNSLQLVFFIGDRFSTENTISHTRAGLTQRVTLSNAPDFLLSVQLNLWDYQGSFRWVLRDGAVAPYVKLGYGVSRYRLEEVSTNGIPFSDPRSRWVTRLNGNTGAGAEWVLLRSRERGWLSGLDFGIRAEWQMLVHKLGLDEKNLPLETLVPLGFTADTIPRNDTIFRHQFVVRAMVTY